MLGKNYKSYNCAIKELKLTELKVRRENITYNFALKSSTHPKHKNWFQISEYDGPNTRSKKPKFLEVKSNKSGLKNGPISYMTKLLNCEN